MDEETIVAIRAVKIFINLCGSPLNVGINRRLMDLCEVARKKYFAFLDAKKEKESLTLKGKRLEMEKRKAETVRKTYGDKVSEIDSGIAVENSKFQSAEALIADGNKTLLNVINSKGKINKTELIKAQMLLQTGMEKVSESKSKICDLQNKQKSSIVKKN